ncbi:MAG: hypothetical protein O2958_02960 [Gemmatimonadetes bacterium]|nr:hypothetical protein [Gemmatimonadota bacterium]MDA1102277.1 hypothetical protein [Gemmatimonadota bacterium]
MRHNLVMVLIGASFLVPLDASAQRTRDTRDRGPRATQPAPITVSSRIAPRSRVVYSSHSSRYRREVQDRFWVRVDWGRDRVALRHRARAGVLNHRRLVDVLGHRAVDRVHDAGRRAGLRGALRGHWEDTRGRGSILIVTMDRVEIAEFLDYDGDGFIDDVYMIREARDRRGSSRW